MPNYTDNDKAYRAIGELAPHLARAIINNKYKKKREKATVRNKQAGSKRHDGGKERVLINLRDRVGFLCDALERGDDRLEDRDRGFVKDVVEKWEKYGDTCYFTSKQNWYMRSLIERLGGKGGGRESVLKRMKEREMRLRGRS